MSLLKYKAQWEKLAYKVGKYKTHDEALAAVKQGGHALVYVKEQTEEICLAAVKESGCALQYVHTQTEAICLAAVKQDIDALQYVHPRFLEGDDIIVLNGVKYKKVSE
jgi:hypothetical protein